MTSILSNVTAMSASRQLGITSSGMQQTIERLTTGKRINRASDDAAGLTAADGFDAQARAANQSVQTANNSYFAAQAGDGYLAEATTQVQRLVELDSGGNGGSAEATAVVGNAVNAISKALSAAGAPTTALSAALTAVSAALGQAGSATGITALSSIDAARSSFAATMATNQSAANLSGIEAENATSQKSNVMDANIGNEVVNLTKWQVLSQAGTSALSSANSSSQYILALFR
jgi:flagellin